MSRKNRRNREEKRKAQQHNAAAGQEAAPNPAVDTQARLTKSDTFLTKIRKEKAAQFLAEGNLSITALAANLGVTRETIYAWQREPEFAARVAEMKRDIAELEKRFVIARKMFRLMDLEELRQSLQRIRDARAEKLSVPQPEGGDSGFLVRRVRMIGSGENAREVEEYVFDAAAYKAWLETLKQAAQEVGQWVEKVAPTTPDGKDEYIGIPAVSLEEYNHLPVAERIRLLRSSLRVPPVDRTEPPAGMGTD